MAEFALWGATSPDSSTRVARWELSALLGIGSKVGARVCAIEAEEMSPIASPTDVTACLGNTRASVAPRKLGTGTPPRQPVALRLCFAQSVTATGDLAQATERNSQALNYLEYLNKLPDIRPIAQNHRLGISPVRRLRLRPLAWPRDESSTDPAQPASRPR